MAVGGIGMICTANYEARKFGVRAAMPGFIARRLCPQLQFAKPDFSKYSKAAKATRLVFQDFDPDFSCGSLDEAYIDATAHCASTGLTGAACPRCQVRSQPALFQNLADSIRFGISAACPGHCMLCSWVVAILSMAAGLMQQYAWLLPRGNELNKIHYTDLSASNQKLNIRKLAADAHVQVQKSLRP